MISINKEMQLSLKKIADAAADERDFSYTTRKILSIVLLSFSTFLALLPYTGTRFIFFKANFSIAPDFISGVVALFLILPLYARGILRWSSSIYGSLMFVLFLAVYASLAKLALLGKGDLPLYLLTASIVLSWLGMRAVAGFGWILTFSAAIISSLSTSAAMGLNGFLFIASAFLGLVMHSNLSPSRLIEELVAEYSKIGAASVSSVKHDVSAAREKLD